MLRMDDLPHGRDDDVAEESTTRFYVEATDGRTFDGAWFRGTLGGIVSPDGYTTRAAAEADMEMVNPYDHRPVLTDVRVVEELVTCRITVVARRA